MSEVPLHGTTTPETPAWSVGALRTAQGSGVSHSRDTGRGRAQRLGPCGGKHRGLGIVGPRVSYCRLGGAVSYERGTPVVPPPHRGRLLFRVSEVQGYLAHKKQPPLGPYSGARGWAFSYDRGTPATL